MTFQVGDRVIIPAHGGITGTVDRVVTRKVFKGCTHGITYDYEVPSTNTGKPMSYSWWPESHLVPAASSKEYEELFL